MLDNALARAVIAAGHECLLVPLYTPIRTDEDNVSVERVFYGGINVYLQQKMPWLRFLPRFFDASLNRVGVIQRLTKNTGKVSPKLLGQLTVSMLKGLAGNQRKELVRLGDWLAEHIQPDAIVLSNLMIAGGVGYLCERLNAPAFVVMQGDDIFLDSLPDNYRKESERLMRGLIPQLQGVIFHSQDYARRMGERLDIPEAKRAVLPLGIDARDLPVADPPERPDKDEFTIGYLARIAPEKGFDRLVAAVCRLPRQLPWRVRAAGYLGPQHEDYLRTQLTRLREVGLADRFEYVGSVDRTGKVDFLRSLDLLCVPTRYREPKGLFVLEAAAAGVPYLLPNHGAFTEIDQRLGFGQLFEPENDEALLRSLTAWADPETRPHFDVDREQILHEIGIAQMAERFLDILHRS